MGLASDVGQHDPVLGVDHHRRRPALPGTGPPHEHTHSPAGPSPEQLLAERFVRGEINEEEYQRRLAALRASPPSTKPG
ncbi:MULTISPECIES: SHOCT domain-containing protein [unclassified Streptomyces]|uniref:SHOCT domain-containing protein n=1 Tax=unclassified Streptomyces TaxID=2593676 RepID=UPI002E1C07B9|nr:MULTISPECIES: SHOCT domain-containing protein [unclassified Streptomyces]